MNYSLIRMICVAGAALTLTACAGLHDVSNKWGPPDHQKQKPVQETPVQETITLKADALFAFDQGHLGGMLPAGRTELDKVAEKIRTGYARVDSIELVGHTDRLGSDAYNMRLSQERADTVKSYLQQHGVAAPISAIGKGETQPVTHGCVGEIATRALTECLQPDRRVEVIITGIRRGKK